MLREPALNRLALLSLHSSPLAVIGSADAGGMNVYVRRMADELSSTAADVLGDTAGRLQTKINLMEELKKMRRIVEREMGREPDETLLVLDGTTGQNAVSQAKLFNEATALTGVVVTKLDSTAKGGVLVAIVDALEIPIKFVGLGETADSLRPFSPSEFIGALFEDSEF